MTDLWRRDATAQAALVAAGEVTARELTELALARLEELGALNVAVGIDAERALARADDVLEGPFAGVPFLVKDLLPYPGFRCAMGSRLFQPWVPQEPTPLTRAIDAMGLVVLGKSTTSELGLLGSTETALEGVTLNPWDRARSAGGSSGGAAAAVAAGIVPLAHASDGGGSIRIPAALGGLVGFKPSRGRGVPALNATSDLLELTIDLCVSRSVRDTARFVAASERAEGPWPRMGMVTRGDERLRIGLYETSLMGAAAPEGGARAVAQAAGLCRELGHEVEAISPPPISGEALSRAFFTMAGAAVDGMFAMMGGMRGQPVQDDEVEPFTRELVAWWRGLGPDALEEARRFAREAEAAMGDYLARWDVTLCPTLGVATPELGFLAPSVPRETALERTEQLAGYTPIHNLAGAPAISLPLSEHDGLPVGVMFAAAAGQDARLLRLAYQLEEAAPWSERWPSAIG